MSFELTTHTHTHADTGEPPVGSTQATSAKRRTHNTTIGNWKTENRKEAYRAWFGNTLVSQIVDPSP